MSCPAACANRLSERIAPSREAASPAATGIDPFDVPVGMLDLRRPIGCRRLSRQHDAYQEESRPAQDHSKAVTHG